MFKIHNGAKKWGENLITKDSPIKTQFDIYYLSMLVGIGLGRSKNYDAADVNDITKNVTDPYLAYRYVIAGLLLVSDFANAKIPITKPSVKERVSSFLDSHSQTYLTDSAVELMNQYAYGGFEAMREEMQKAPDVHDFLIWYHEVLMPKCFSSGLWG